MSKKRKKKQADKNTELTTILLTINIIQGIVALLNSLPHHK